MKRLTLFQHDMYYLHSSVRFQCSKSGFRTVGPIVDEVQLVICTGSPETLSKCCRKWSVPDCTMHLNDFPRLPFVVNFLIRTKEMLIHRSMQESEHTCISSATVAPTDDSDAYCGTAMLVETKIVYRRFIARYLHCPDTQGF